MTEFQPFLRFYSAFSPPPSFSADKSSFQPFLRFYTRPSADALLLDLLQFQPFLRFYLGNMVAHFYLDTEKEFQPFLRFYPPTADPRIPTRHATEVSTLLEILPWAYIPLMAFALHYKVSTLLEILRRSSTRSSWRSSPGSFNPS